MKWWSLEIPSCDAVRAIFSLSSLAGSTCLARCPRVARVPEGQRIIAGDFARRGRGTCLTYQGYLSDHVPHRRTPLQPGGLPESSRGSERSAGPRVLSGNPPGCESGFGCRQVLLASSATLS